MVKAKRDFGVLNIVIVALVFLGLGIIGGFYYFSDDVKLSGPADPNLFGHSADEISGVCKSDGTGCPELGDSCILSYNYNCFESERKIYSGTQFSNRNVSNFSSYCDSYVGVEGVVNCFCKYSEPSCMPANVCGNGIVEGNEQCDDGNSNKFDDCSNLCTINTLSSFNVIVFMPGAKFSDGHVISSLSLGLSSYDDFRDGASSVCTSLAGGFLGSTGKVGAGDGSLRCEAKHNGAWLSGVACTWEWIECIK
ncbi:MAG: DUF4215 domain-containing protein [Nanoarchaeota archaeon]